MTGTGDFYIIEPNANPCIAKIDEVAQAALKAGISYEDVNSESPGFRFITA